ncbi:MAG TPA: crossover junction endodeoxyribonuclease RuvC [Candidatus Paceibacterota bacterium]
MKVLGIDPGIERVGWGVIQKTPTGFVRLGSGVFKTHKTLPQEKRLVAIYHFLTKFLLKTKPDAVGIERLFFAANAKTAITVGEARGVILLAAAERGLMIQEFTPLQVKMAVCGDGRADKKRVAAMLRHSITLPQRSLLDDETDALAIALTTLVYKKISS